jgi:predicted O-methyltransferase YrrM
MNYYRLLSLNYEDKCTTDKSHIISIYNFASRYSGRQALEIGSYKGHSTLALALAGLSVVSYDFDTEHTNQRENLLKGFDVEWNCLHSQHSLNDFRTFDVIFHDADHGNTIVHELEILWHKVNPNGLFIVHDFEQISIPLTFVATLIYCTKDRSNRELAIFRKNSNDLRQQ